MQGFYGMRLQSRNSGEGTLVGWDSDTITVKFGENRVRYYFPRAFECGDLQTTNAEDEAFIREMIKQSYLKSGEKKAQRVMRNTYTAQRSASGAGLRTAAGVFMTINCIGTVVCVVLLCVLEFYLGLIGLVSLAWLIPMTVHCWSSARANVRTGTAFNVCTLLFANFIAAIFLFIADSFN